MCIYCNSYAKNNNALNEIINSLKHSKSKSQLVLKRDSLNAIHNESIEEIRIIYNVFLAELIANKQEKINTESSNLYKIALTNSIKNKNIGLSTWVKTYNGYYFYKYNDYKNALPFFLDTARILNDIDSNIILDASEVLKKNGYFFATTNDYDQSINFLKKGLLLKNPTYQSTFLDALGICYYEKKITDSAYYYFKQAKEVALQQLDTIRFAKALGNIARTDILLGNYENAEKLLLKDIELSEKLKDERNVMFAKIELAKLYLAKKELGKAKKVIHEARNFALTKSYLKSFDLETAKLLLSIATLEKNDYEELKYRRAVDSLNTLISNKEGIEILKQIAFESEKDKILLKLEAEQIKAKNATNTKWLFIVIAILLMVIIILIFSFNRKKIRLLQNEFDSKISLYKSKRLESEKRLKSANQSLDSFKYYLEEKNTQIIMLERELLNIKNYNNTHNNDQKDAIEALLQSHLLTNENWMEFKNRFINEKTEFYNDLTSNFPDLTESNLRIVMLTNLNLNNQEMAKILGVTIDAIKKSKQRLRKKYGEDFDKYLHAN